MTVVRNGKRESLRCAEAVHSRLFDEELVILDLAKGEYFALDSIGARLWSGLEAGKTIEEIAQSVVDEYDVEAGQAIADLCALADELVAKGLMVSAEEGVRSDQDPAAR